MRTPREEAHAHALAKPHCCGLISPHGETCDALTAVIENARAEGLVVYRRCLAPLLTVQDVMVGDRLLANAGISRATFEAKWQESFRDLAEDSR